MDLEWTIRDAGASVEGPLRRLEDALSYEGLADLDAAVLDIDVAGCEIFEFADRLAVRRIPIVFHTGRSDVSRLGARYPGAEVVLKPCLSTNLVATLTAVIRPRQPDKSGCFRTA